jgi:hypothetical protein
MCKIPFQFKMNMNVLNELRNKIIELESHGNKYKVCSP